MVDDSLDPTAPGDSPAGDDQPADTENTEAPQPHTLVMSEETEPRETPERIGPYRLLQRLGEGGMGEVWEAEQSEPVQRRVALKVIKPGMDTKEVIARFEAERQALALMNHSAIARVFDAGQTPGGRPYFVMELVRGIPITRYCDKKTLTNRERLELFQEVCEGVQHAHQKAIIHRDLKPSNILVTRTDDRAHPKIIDFGIAKAMAQPLTDKTMHTQLGMMIGTPEYMSPEQAEMSGEAVDTRTDVYSLGVVLYELLSGELPFDPQELRSAGVEGIRKKICEEEPQTPSTRVSGMGALTAEAAEKRRLSPDALQRELKGDLDWIVMKALAKEPDRRYGSPRELGLDLQRYLESQPVDARPPSTSYRVGKFVRRHRAGVAAAGLVALALMLGIAGTTVGLVQARKEAQRADMEAEAARQVATFLTDLFEVSDPGEARGNTVTARELLDKGAARISGELEDQPLVRARMMQTMGEVYRKLGLYEQAEPLIEEALAVQEMVDETGDYELATGLGLLGALKYDQGKHADAEPLLIEAITVLEKTFGPDHPDVAASLNDLGNVCWRLGRFEEAEEHHRRALAIRQQAFGYNHPDVAESHNYLGVVISEQGRFEEAQEEFQKGLEIREATLGPDHPRVADSLINVGIAVKKQGRPEEAEPYYLRAIALHEKTLGPNHPVVTTGLNNLGEMLRVLGRPKEGEPYVRRALAICEETLDPEHHLTFIVVWTLADNLRDQQRYDEAEALYLRALRIVRILGPDGHPALRPLTAEYAKLLRAAGRESEADELEARSGARL